MVYCLCKKLYNKAFSPHFLLTKWEQSCNRALHIHKFFYLMNSDVHYRYWKDLVVLPLNNFLPLLQQRKPDMRQVHAVFTRTNGLHGARERGGELDLLSL